MSLDVNGWGISPGKSWVLEELTSLERRGVPLLVFQCRVVSPEETQTHQVVYKHICVYMCVYVTNIIKNYKLVSGAYRRDNMEDSWEGLEEIKKERKWCNSVLIKNNKICIILTIKLNLSFKQFIIYKHINYKIFAYDHLDYYLLDKLKRRWICEPLN